MKIQFWCKIGSSPFPCQKLSADIIFQFSFHWPKVIKLIIFCVKIQSLDEVQSSVYTKWLFILRAKIQIDIWCSFSKIDFLAFFGQKSCNLFQCVNFSKHNFWNLPHSRFLKSSSFSWNRNQRNGKIGARGNTNQMNMCTEEGSLVVKTASSSLRCV